MASSAGTKRADGSRKQEKTKDSFSLKRARPQQHSGRRFAHLTSPIPEVPAETGGPSPTLTVTMGGKGGFWSCYGNLSFQPWLLIFLKFNFCELLISPLHQATSSYAIILYI